MQRGLLKHDLLYKTKWRQIGNWFAKLVWIYKMEYNVMMSNDIILQLLRWKDIYSILLRENKKWAWTQKPIYWHQEIEKMIWTKMLPMLFGWYDLEKLLHVCTSMFEMFTIKRLLFKNNQTKPLNMKPS